MRVRQRTTIPSRFYNYNGYTKKLVDFALNRVKLQNKFKPKENGESFKILIISTMGDNVARINGHYYNSYTGEKEDGQMLQSSDPITLIYFGDDDVMDILKKENWDEIYFEKGTNDVAYMNSKIEEKFGNIKINYMVEKVRDDFSDYN